MSLWVEKYRPQKISDLILPERYVTMLNNIVKTQNVTNMLLVGSPGTGKTSLSKVICNELGIDYEINNSSENRGIDILRTTIARFAVTGSSNGKYKVMIMDECLHEEEYVVIGTVDNNEKIKLKDLEKDKIYPVVSYDMEANKFENDYAMIVSDKDDELYEVELEDGRKIILTSNHPFIINANGINIEKTIDNGLSINDMVVIYE